MAIWQIDDKHAALLADGLNLGSAVGAAEELYDGGYAQSYQFGRIWFHPRIGEAFEVHGLILSTYLARGAERGELGYPISDELQHVGTVGGRVSSFEQGLLAYDPATGVDAVSIEPTLVPQVSLKIDDGIFVPLGPGGQMSLSTFAAAIVGPGYEGVLGLIETMLPALRLRRVFDSHSGDDIQVLIDQARAADPGYEPPNFNNFLEIDCPQSFDTDALAAALSQLGGIVEYAYTAPVASNPAVAGTPNPLFSKQVYLTAAPAGINVQAAWAKGADGSGTRFIDVEQGWFLGHEDLPSGIKMLGSGRNEPRSFYHGAAVLGTIVGRDDNRGICGIAPKASARVLSYNHLKQPFNSRESRQSIADAILQAQWELSFGDVLLVEAQLDAEINGVTRRVPVETDRAIREVIRLATRRNVTVVEAAGNKAANLDDFVDHEGKHVLDRQSADFKDSGAIMVGASQSAPPHAPITAESAFAGASISSFGTRLDCYAWGENIVTCGSQTAPTKADAYFTGPYFGGTSGAAAIIAGVCLIVQDLFQRLNPAVGAPGKISAARMRDVLTKPTNSTAGAPGASLGVMPDLKKLIAHEFV